MDPQKWLFFLHIMIVCIIVLWRWVIFSHQSQRNLQDMSRSKKPKGTCCSVCVVVRFYIAACILYLKMLVFFLHDSRDIALQSTKVEMPQLVGRSCPGNKAQELDLRSQPWMRLTSLTRKIWVFRFQSRFQITMNIGCRKVIPLGVLQYSRLFIYLFMTGWWFGCHEFYFPINIGNLIIPIDELIFFRGVALAHQPDTILLLLCSDRER